MVKLKKTTSFVCQECGYDTASWLGKCPECGMWNTFKEVRFASSSSQTTNGPISPKGEAKVQKLSDIAYHEKSRISTTFEEMNTVLGGGIVLGSVTLLAGDPGVGKSTLLLQLCLAIAKTGKKVLYISGEESVEQVKMRAERLQGGKKATSAEDNLFLVALTDPDQAAIHIEDTKPELVVVDSIQTMQSENAGGLSGAVAQVRYAALVFVRLAKSMNIPIILVGHVTKEGMVAGPMVLSHMVDTVLFLEGEKFARLRILRSLKNRFGPVDEVGIFQMAEFGMTEAQNLEELFLTNAKDAPPGSVLAVAMEGTRPLLVELQALTVYSRLPMPRRVVSGLDPKRVELLLAVLQKHARLPVDGMDVFVNVAGGIKISDPGIDLAICLAIYSSLKNTPFAQTVGIAEVGLLGELREVTGSEKRIREAKKLGIKHIISTKKYKSLSAVIAGDTGKYQE